MIMLGLVLGAAMASLPVIRPTVDVSGRDLRLGDLLVTTRTLPRPALAQLVVARLPQGVRRLTLPARTVAALIHRRVPGLELATPVFDRVEVRSAVSDLSPRAGRVCFEIVRSIAADTAITSDDVAPARCRNEAGARLRYRDGTVQATSGLAAGTYVGQLLPLPAEAIGVGTTLSLRAASGPVAIERTVTAMQAGRLGQRIFVRDAEGSIFAARFDTHPRQAGAR